MNMHLRERPSHVRTFELIETEALRQRMEAAIEILLATLDALDGDDGLEPDNDNEPSLGWTGEGRGCATLGNFDAGDDRELDDADDEDNHDREADEEREIDHDFEPSLGGADDDREFDDTDDEDSHDRESCLADDCGVGDADGMAEQYPGFAYGAAL